MKTKLMLLFAGVLLLAACSGSRSPQLIAAQPAGEAIATYPRPQYPYNPIILNATLEINVASVDQAAERAKGIAFDQGGYLVKAQSWHQEGQKHTMLILAVPSHHFEAARNALLRLGSLVGESISGERVDADESQWTVYSQITVYLRPQTSTIPELSLSKRRPLVTLAKAWDVFLWIFGFFLDVFIWVVVVGGPFLLLGWIVRALIRLRQKGCKRVP